jgi:hypothetical protein
MGARDAGQYLGHVRTEAAFGARLEFFLPASLESFGGRGLPEALKNLLEGEKQWGIHGHHKSPLTCTAWLFCFQ